MVNINETIAAVQKLSADAIRQRIEEIDRERKSLMVLLRAASSAERKQQPGGTS